MYQAIFFDLDGTLLPMDQEVFTKAYFAKLSEKLAVTGKTAGELVPAVWAGVKQMVKNDGKRTNETVFWETFVQLTGLSEEVVRPLCEDFYKVDFHAVRPVTGKTRWRCGRWRRRAPFVQMLCWRAIRCFRWTDSSPHELGGAVGKGFYRHHLV